MGPESQQGRIDDTAFALQGAAYRNTSNRPNAVQIMNEQTCLSHQKVTIIGAGGNLGPTILSAFDVDPYFNVSVPARSPLHTASPPTPKSTTSAITTLKPKTSKCQAVISTIITANAVQQKSTVDTTIKAVKCFVPREFGKRHM